MINIIDIYAKKHGTTRYQISKISGVAQTTLADSGKKKFENMSVKIIKALALATHSNLGNTLNELNDINGNPIIQFIRDHKNLNKDMVNELEDLIIWHGLNGGSFNNISFNRYYDEGSDTDERAEIALKNVIDVLQDLKNSMQKDGY